MFVKPVKGFWPVLGIEVDEVDFKEGDQATTNFEFAGGALVSEHHLFQFAFHQQLVDWRHGIISITKRHMFDVFPHLKQI